jgi:hypothetical protein
MQNTHLNYMIAEYYSGFDANPAGFPKPINRWHLHFDCLDCMNLFLK